MTDVRVFATAADLVASAADEFVRVISTAQSERGVARVVLTGGSNGIAILRLLRDVGSGLDWSAIEFFWGDDRFVGSDDPDRNSKQAREALLDQVGVPAASIHEMAAADGAFGDDIEAATADYAATVDAVDSFDIHLLGMGGEGHINSLFPHTDAVSEPTRSVVAVLDSPKPPARRITLTLPAVRRARQVWLLVAGTDKAEAASAGIAGANAADWPCAGAIGSEGTVWFLDTAAASALP